MIYQEEIADTQRQRATQDDESEYCARLLNYTNENRQTSYEDIHLLEFSTLQRMNLVHIQNQLAEIKADAIGHQKITQADLKSLRQLLHEYTVAIRDHEYLNSLPRIQDPQVILDRRILLGNAFPSISQRPGAPYDSACLTLRHNIARKEDGVREFLRKHLYRGLAWSSQERGAHRVKYNQGLPPEHYSEFLDGLARFLIAVGGGCSLVLPMIIMTFNPSVTKSLITVSVAVVLFALVMSLTFQTDNKDTLTATATYAAVLVVFVGTSGAGG